MDVPTACRHAYVASPNQPSTKNPGHEHAKKIDGAIRDESKSINRRKRAEPSPCALADYFPVPCPPSPLRNSQATQMLHLAQSKPRIPRTKRFPIPSTRNKSVTSFVSGTGSGHR